MIAVSISVLVGIVGFVLGQRIANYTRNLDDQFANVYRQIDEEQRVTGRSIERIYEELNKSYSTLNKISERVRQNAAKGKN